MHLRPDDVLQNIVYKIVPGIFTEEMRRRRDYYTRHSEDSEAVLNDPEAKGTRQIFSPEEMISLSLEMCCSNEDRGESDELKVIRYLLCPAAVTIGHLKKFMKIKFSLSDTYRVDVFYADEILCDSYSLVDVAYISSWKRKDVLKLNYAVYENPVKRIKLTPTCDVDVNGNDDSGIEDGNTSLDSTNNNTSASTSFNDSCISEDLNSSVEQPKPSKHIEDAVSTSDDTTACTSIPTPMEETATECSEKSEASNSSQVNREEVDDQTDKVPNESEPCEYNYIMDQPGDLIIDESVTSGDQSLDSTVEVPEVNSTKVDKSVHSSDDCCPEDNHVTSTSVSDKLDKHVCDFGTQTSPYTNHVTDQNNDIHQNGHSDSFDYRKEQTSPLSYRIKDRCTGVCNGHEVKPREDKIVVKFSKERNSETYIIT